MDALIPLPALHDTQRRVIGEARRFNVVCCGRRWGKTLLGIDRAVWGVLGRTPVGWFAPTYKYLLEPWQALVRTLHPITLRISQSERRLECLGGGSLECWSMDDKNAGRGRAYGRVVVDEAAMILDFAELWQAAIYPTLTDLGGDAWFFSTPKGFDYFHTLYEHGQDPARPEWASWQLPTASNPHLPPAFVAAAVRSLDPRYYAQEYLASFEEMVGRVYFRFERAANVRADLQDPGGPLLVGMDFNVNPMSAVVGVRVGDELHALDEIELPNSNTEEMAEALRARYPGRPITIYPDPTANARKSSAPVGQTDFTILRRAGFGLSAPTGPTPVADRINEVNALACTAAGRRRLFIHPQCRAVIRSLLQLSYKDGASVVDKRDGLDHMADALGYLIHQEFPLQSVGAPVSRVRWG